VITYTDDSLEIKPGTHTLSVSGVLISSCLQMLCIVGFILILSWWNVRLYHSASIMFMHD